MSEEMKAFQLLIDYYSTLQMRERGSNRRNAKTMTASDLFIKRSLHFEQVWSAYTCIIWSQLFGSLLCQASGTYLSKIVATFFRRADVAI